MTKGILIDLNKCIGCRGCQAACKQWHDLPAERTYNFGSYQNPPDLSAKTWTVVRFDELGANGDFKWVFTKRQCMHCEHPACVAACTVGALTKTETGPVITDKAKCIGCRYCQYACPFGVPSFQWDETMGVIGKCTMCIDRIEEGHQPACANTCPTGAILFGNRDELLTEAKARIAASPGDYVDHVYGEKEVGGTSVLYLSPVPFNQIGLPELGEEPVADLAETIVGQTPAIAIGVAAVASGLYFIMKRRERGLAKVRVKTEEAEQ
jgi:formate dehydrogenase iron-sulfur subunit